MKKFAYLDIVTNKSLSAKLLYSTIRNDQTTISGTPTKRRLINFVAKTFQQHVKMIETMKLR